MEDPQFIWREKKVIWGWEPESYRGERSALVKLWKAWKKAGGIA